MKVDKKRFKYSYKAEAWLDNRNLCYELAVRMYNRKYEEAKLLAEAILRDMGDSELSSGE